MGVATDIASHLQDLGVPNVYVAFEPAERITPVVILVPYGGAAPIFTQDGPDSRTDQPRFSIETRDFSRSAAESLGHAVQNKVTRILNTKINGVVYQYVRPLSDPAFLRRDDQERWVFTASYEAAKQPDLAELSES